MKVARKFSRCNATNIGHYIVCSDIFNTFRETNRPEDRGLPFRHAPERIRKHLARQVCYTDLQGIMNSRNFGRYGGATPPGRRLEKMHGKQSKESLDGH